MIRPAHIVLAAAAIGTPAAAADVQIATSGPVVELNVSQTVKAKPDIATVSAGVTSMAPTAVKAMADNAAAMDAVIKRIKALGIKTDDIQTSGINLGAQYDYDQQTRQQVFRGYQASNRVTVILRDIPRTGNVLDALVAAGATDIGGPDFSIDDPTAARAQARTAALDTAKAQAMEYARWAGYSDMRLLSVQESIPSDRPMPYAARDAIMATGSKVSTPVEPGQVGTSVNLTVKYELTR